MITTWRPTTALLTALAATTVALALALVMRRADLVVIAAPFLIGTLAALGRRPTRTGDDELTLRTPSESVWEGDIADVGVDVRSTDPFELARIDVEHGIGVTAHGTATTQVVRAGDPATASIALRAVHWGSTIVGPVTVTLTAAHGLLRRGSPARRTSTVAVVPLRSVFDATDAVPRAAGLVGTHRSRLPGQGTDLLAVRPYLPGDRLRRITWPVSLRTGQLHVTTTTDDRDTEVQLVVDSVVEIGDPASATGTSLDVAVRAAASVAEHYLRQGDRVGVLDLGSLRAGVPLGAGRRHMTRIVAGLLGATSTAVDAERAGRQLRDIAPRALVMVFSTLLDESIHRHLAVLARAGHTLLVVDTLPPDVRPVRATDWTSLAWRLALVARENLVGRLAELGVPVVAWQGAGSLDPVLRGMSRVASAPRRAR